MAWFKVTLNGRQKHLRQDSQEMVRLGEVDVPADTLWGAQTQRSLDHHEMRYLQWPAKQPIKPRAAGILKHQHHAAAVMRQRDGSRGPVSC
jgi:fumarate hydratase class II